MLKRKTIILAFLAVAMVMSMGIAPAFGYFTDYTQANGGLQIGVKPSTDINEWYAESAKHVVVTNAANATSPVYVRARVFSSLDYTATGINWGAADSDGWMLYGQPVDPGGKTEELVVNITFPTVQSADAPDGAVIDDNYNVIVVYESTPVQYDEAGNPYADWSIKLDSGN